MEHVFLKKQRKNQVNFLKFEESKKALPYRIFSNKCPLHFVSKIQPAGFYISGTLVENGLIKNEKF